MGSIIFNKNLQDVLFNIESKNMTWGEFKRLVEEQDKDNISWIDVTECHIPKYPNGNLFISNGKEINADTVYDTSQ